MSANDRLAIHEAMEQQTISVAKAGLICSLNTRCSIIAACNSKTDLLTNSQIDLTNTTGLTGPLLSRFDLIFAMLDTNNLKRDEKVADYILSKCQNLQSNNDEIVDETESKSKINIDLNREFKTSSKTNWWSLNKLSNYISFIQSNYFPSLTPLASDILYRYYRLQRSNDLSGQSRISIRLLESLIRLSCAHAKLCCRQKVSLFDSITAILLMEKSVRTCSIMSGTKYYNIINAHSDDDEIFYMDKMNNDQKCDLIELQNTMMQKLGFSMNDYYSDLITSFDSI